MVKQMSKHKVALQSNIFGLKMKKEIVFKILELKTHQVLLTKEFDEDGDPAITVSFFMELGKISFGLAFDSENKRDKAFNEFTEAQAQELINNIDNLANNGIK